MAACNSYAVISRYASRVMPNEMISFLGLSGPRLTKAHQQNDRRLRSAPILTLRCNVYKVTVALQINTLV
jgi:hypothetical protein